jgi:hypothetical protein
MRGRRKKITTLIRHKRGEMIGIVGEEGKLHLYILYKEGGKRVCGVFAYYNITNVSST